jgi:hypothetical protein
LSESSSAKCITRGSVVAQEEGAHRGGVGVGEVGVAEHALDVGLQPREP